MRYALLSVLLYATGMLWAVEGQLDELPTPAPAPHARKPAAPAADAPAKPVAVEFSWEEYHSLVVVGDGVGLIRPAWVATYEQPIVPSGVGQLLAPVFGMFGYRDDPVPEKLAVAYRAQAWMDAQGRMHIDARSAVLAGPQSDNWSPDSFIFTLPALVETVDDEDRANRGTVTRVVDPVQAPDLFRELQTKAQVVVGDGI
jgi:hypothetical protein